MRKTLIWIVTVHIILFLFAISANAGIEPKNVLVLNSYHKGFPWTDNIVEGIESVLGSEENNIELVVEFMDTKSIGYSEEYKQVLYELYRHKYRDKFFDLIISSDDNAFNFIRDYHHELFSGAPVVFCGVNNRNAPNIVDPELFTGVLESTAHQETFKLIKKLHPQTKKIYLVIDTTPSGVYRWKVTSPSFSKFPDIDFIRLSDEHSIEEIENTVSGLGNDSAVVFFTLYRDKSGRYISLKEGATRITSASARPVYTTHLLELPYGVVGGKVLGGFHHGEFTADLALRIINGEAVSDIPVVKESPTEYVFNYAQLEKWDIALSSLPEGSTILNRPFSFYEEYKALVWSVLAAIITLAGMVLTLQINIINRKRAQADAVKGRAEFEAIFDSISEGIVFADPHRKIVRVNRAFNKMFGYQIEEIAGQTTQVIYADPDNYTKKGQERFNPKAQIDHSAFENEYRRKDGTTFIGETIGDHVIDESGQLLGYIGIIHDVTERQKAEQALRKSEEKYRGLFTHMITEVHLWELVRDASGAVKTWRLADANPAALKSWGQTLPEVLGKTTDEIFPDSNATELFLPVVQKIFADGKPHRWESYFSDTNQYLQMISIPMGEFFISTGMDISQQRQREEELLHTHINLKEAISSGRVGLWDWDLASNKVEFSSEWKKQIGYEDHEVSNDLNEWESRVHPEDLPDTLKKVQTAIEKVKKGYETEFRFKHKDGSYRWILVHGSIITDKGGNPIRMLGSHIDITERKQSEIKHLELETQLKQKYKMEAVGVLAGGMAHNFNNNLSIVLGNLELLRAQLKDRPDELDFLNNALIGVSRSRELIEQIMTFSRIGEHTKKSIDLRQVLDEARGLLRATIPSSVELNYLLEGDLPLTLAASPTRVQEILFNLCNNAVHAMNEKGTLTIKLSKKTLPADDIPATYPECQPGDFACLTVADTGCGIGNELIEKIFDPFFTTKATNAGTGMGLSSVHGYLSDIGGMIKVKSRLGDGSSFSLYFPLVDEVLQESAPPAEAGDYRGNERILLVDDDPLIATLNQRILAEEGYQVTMETDSVAALERFCNNPDAFDMVITDQTMPNLNGDELLAQMLKVRPDLSTIICTGYSSKIDEIKAAAGGIGKLLLKPVTREEFLAAAREVFDQPKSLSDAEKR